MILLLRPPRRSPLLPYTTLFRSGRLTLGPATGSLPVQVGFDELGLPLSEVTFVVVDLETTGGSATRDAITEVGAVKDRKSTRLNSSHVAISYAVFCLKKKNQL